MPSAPPDPEKEIVFWVDTLGNISPTLKTAATVGDTVMIKLKAPFAGKVYATQSGVNRCAKLFGIQGLDHLAFDHAYAVVEGAAGQTFTITTSIPSSVTQTGELEVGSRSES